MTPRAPGYQLAQKYKIYSFKMKIELIEPNKKLDELARAVINAAIEVHRQLGPGYNESFYEKALTLEFLQRSIPFERQKTINVYYKNKILGASRLDFLIDNQLILELKVIDRFARIHMAQLLSYLKASKCHLGLLINFNVTNLLQGVKRVVLSKRN